MRKIPVYLSISTLLVSCATKHSLRDWIEGGTEESQNREAQGETDAELAEGEPLNDLLYFFANDGYAKKFPTFKDKQLDSFNYFCRNGRQIRPIKVKIKAAIGKPPGGIPLDAAQRIQSHKRELTRYYARSFFTLTNNDALKYDDPKVEEKGNIVTLYDDVRSAVNAKKNQRVACSVDFHQYRKHYLPWKGPKYKNAHVLEQKDHCKGLTLLSFGGKQPLVMSLNGVPRLKGKTYRSQVGYVFASTPLEKWNKKPIKIRSGPAEYKAHRLYPMTSFEPFIFTYHFTMLIPAKVQDQFFGQGRWSKFYRRDANYRLNPGFFLNGDGSFNITDAIKRKKQLWRDYLDLATVVKEAQTKEPNIINYEVSLNLDLFCKYGRRVSDLYSN